MRRALNRIAVAVLLGALLVLAVLVAVEAAARLAGAGTQIEAIDYRAWWTDVVEWDPGRALTLVVLIGVGLAGLALLAAELWPRRPERTTEIARSAHGPVLIPTRAVTPYVRGRLREREYVRSSAPKVTVSGTTATIRDRPQTTRPWDDAELADTRTGITRDLRRLGLEADTVVIEPREPSGRGARRVR